MRVAKVIGTVTCSRIHESLAGKRWRVVVPLSQDQLREAKEGRRVDREGLVALDEIGSGLGGLVALTEGAEAAAPFHPAQKPVDAYIAALLDDIEQTA